MSLLRKRSTIHFPMISRRFLSSHQSSNELAEKAVLLGGSYVQNASTLKIPLRQDEHSFDGDLRLLDQSIRKAEYLSKDFKDLKKVERLPRDYANNQYINMQDYNDNELRSLLWKFDAPIRYAFAYGSGVFSQGYSNPDTQTDLIFGVTYPEHWHSINMKFNPDHYSTLKYFGSGVVSKVQEIGAGVYFNPYVEVDGKLVKYGVVSIDALVKDLAQWSSLYLAGRLQKPVKILRDDPIVKFWNQQNLRFAATLGYLNLSNKEAFDEHEFYENITSLSYKGDIRYRLGAENPNKIKKIVANNFNYFQQYYSPILKEVIGEKHFVFPPGFNKENANQKLESIILKSSTSQALKGILTAGFNKSIKYAWAKKLKANAK